MIKTTEAKQIYIKQFHQGRKHGDLLEAQDLPYGTGNDQDFILTEIPVDLIINCPRYDAITEDLVNLYNGQMEPVWLAYGRDFYDGTFNKFFDNKFQVRDGNHRVEAFKRMGMKTIKAYMPINHYNHYKENQ